MGIFVPYDSLNFDQTPNFSNFKAECAFDNFRLYDPNCPNGNVFLNYVVTEDTLQGCPGIAKSVTAQHGRTPYDCMWMEYRKLIQL